MAPIMGDPLGETSETGCLTLNVWTPDVAGSWPVLFWLHGGAWTSGAGSWSCYSGARLAAQQRIVVVTANYRLGPLGYAYLRDFDPGLGEGNFGFADQCAALRWVHREIRAFGGDPERITVGGQSAGGHSAALLAAAPATRPLISRVLLQSAPHGWPLSSPAEAADAAADLLAELEIRPGDVGRLRTIDAAEVVAASGVVARKRHAFASIDSPFQPTRTAALPWKSPLDALAIDAADDLDVLVGTTGQEMRAFFDLDRAVGEADQEQVIAALAAQFAVPDRLYAHYRGCAPGRNPGAVLGEILTDTEFRWVAASVAERRAVCGKPAHVYQFDWRGSRFGSCHCVELPFLFADRDAWPQAPMLDGIDDGTFSTLSAAFSGTVGRFVRTGDPGWAPYTVEEPAMARVGATGPAFSLAAPSAPSELFQPAVHRRGRSPTVGDHR